MQVLVEDLALLVGTLLEACEGVIDRLLGAQIDAELRESRLEGIAPGELAQHQLVGAPADVFRAHDLVGFAVLQHAVLVDAGFVRERVRADDRLVRLHREPGDAGDELRRRNDLCRVDPRRARKDVLARLDGHYDLFERRIACALAQAIDRALDLPRAVHHRGKRVGDRHAQVIVTVHGPYGLVRVWNTLAQGLDQRSELPRHRVADGVRDVDGRRAGVNRRFDETAQEVRLRPARIFGRKLDVLRVLTGQADRLDRLLEDLIGRHTQLHLHVNGRARDERMYPARVGAFERVAGAPDVLLVGASERAYRAVLDRLRNRPHRLEVTVRRSGKSCLDHVGLQAFELLGDAHLFLTGHRRPGALLAVAQGRIENDQVVWHDRLLRAGSTAVHSRRVASAGSHNKGVGSIICARGAAAADRRDRRSKGDAR